jgi:hypothetical protein
MSYVLAQQGGAEALAAVITLQDVWRSLTPVQRGALLHSGHSAALGRMYVTRTYAALIRKGLWGPDGITDLGRAVVQYRPEVTR